jgi:type II secretory pathway pseudopilin PulG
MELMIVVVITSVLATIAIPTFSTYVQKSRTTEAVQFLGTIKLKQEARRAEFGTYLQCPVGNRDLTEGQFAYQPPAAQMIMGNTYNLNNACFTELGALPDAPVRFGYAWIAGTPAEITSNVKNSLGLADTDVDHYFVAHATTDMDGDGTAVIFELSNFSKHIFVMDESYNALPKGWE